MHKRFRFKSSVVEPIDLEDSPNATGSTGLPNSTSPSQSTRSQGPRLDIEKLWDQSIAAASRGENLAEDKSIQVTSLDFYRHRIDRDLDVRTQSHQYVRDVRRFLKIPATLNPTTRLLILHPISNLSPHDLREEPHIKTKLQRQFSSLVSILATLEYDTSVGPSDRLMCLAGWEASYSGGPGVLEALSPRRQSLVKESEWSFERLDTTSLPHSYASLGQNHPFYYKQSPKRATFKISWHKGAVRTPNTTYVIISCNDDAMVDQLCSQISDSATSGADDIDIILQHALAVVNDRTTEILQQVSDMLSETKYTARHTPSWSINNYLLHLEDHLDILQESLRPQLLHTNDTISPPSSSHPETLSPSPSNPPPPSQAGPFQSAIHLLKSQTAQIRTSNRDALASKETSKNKLIAVLAAIYLPFSLASSILGMNVVGLNDGTNAKWYVFLAVGVPLAAMTVALPLSFERLDGMVRRFGERNPVLARRVGRAVVAGCVLVTAAVVVVGVVVATRVVVRR